MYYTRSAYVGQQTKDQKRMHGRGIFTFANGNKYVGTFHDGTFHGQGIIFFTTENGGGQFRGIWDQGKNIEGEYIFSDGLQFATENWGHCTEENRTLWHEYLTFIQPPFVVGAKEGNVMTPNYGTTDGIPPAFAEGKPRGVHDVHDIFWSAAAAPKPEHESVADVRGGEGAPDMATIIANARPK